MHRMQNKSESDCVFFNRSALGGDGNNVYLVVRTCCIWDVTSIQAINLPLSTENNDASSSFFYKWQCIFIAMSRKSTRTLHQTFYQHVAAIM